MLSTLKNGMLFNYSMLLIIVSYFFYKAWPKMLKNPKLYNPNSILIFYNSVQIVLNGFFFKKTLEYVWENFSLMRFFETEAPVSETVLAIRVSMWFFIIDKLMYVLDSVFLIITKKSYNALHLYNHVIIFGGCLIMARYFPNGQIFVIGLLNAFLHSVLCSYHVLSLSSFLKKTGIYTLIKNGQKPKTKHKKLQSAKKKVKSVWSNSVNTVKRKNLKKYHQRSIKKIKEQFKEFRDFFKKKSRSNDINEETDALALEFTHS